jgi:hypothetical protein
MRAVILRKIVSGAVWMISGIVVIVVRTSANRGGSILVWELIGVGMIVFGAIRLIWTLIKTLPTVLSEDSAHSSTSLPL